MVASATPITNTPSRTTIFSALMAANGSAGHAYLSSPDLVSGRNATRNLADVIHHVSLLHGRHPGVIDHAALHIAHPDLRAWFSAATEAFARERSTLTKLVVAIGPIPSTPGQAQTESAVLGQRHALDMLAQSDRVGCAFGAAAALILDWAAIRTVLNFAAKRIGVEIVDCTFPTADLTYAAAEAVAETAAIERAVTFGAQQLLTQHRGLWDLIQSRQASRGDD